MTTVAKYDYPLNGVANETVATLADGTRVTVCPQYKAALVHGDHAEDCEQITKMGGRCTCGKLDGIDVAALLADARENGKFGRAPVEHVEVEHIAIARKGVCPKCGTYCDGDCEANA